MIVGVVGSRTYQGDRAYDYMCAILGTLDMDGMVSGGAEGADKLSERFALEHNLPITVCLPEFSKFEGHRAYYERNKDIVHLSDAIVAFWDGVSKGTRMTMKLCHEAKKPLIIIRTDMMELAPIEEQKC